ncbi:MAG TPA: hypothetical protein DCS42_02400 [Nitrospiraceae bacterium]|jgi:hypothetical protein|nr:hypothetical protein [Nitrospiraceae bacterium]HAS53043.1 hypothetical protein [Nitrospiraceae bacterium]
MDFKVQNANYERVMTVMDKFLRERYAEACPCSRCKNDIAALALNYLPPHYYVDSLENREMGSPWVMVEAAVIEAIDRVQEFPNHPHREKSPAGRAPAFIPR